MAKTDQPFKRLITLIAREFISWALNTEVRSAQAGFQRAHRYS